MGTCYIHNMRHAQPQYRHMYHTHIRIQDNIMYSITYFGFTMLGLITGLSGMCFFLLEYGTYDMSLLSYRSHAAPTIVYDEEGVEIARFQKDSRHTATITHMPPHVIRAFLAAEDHTFYRHAGISIPSIIRSTLKNIYYRRIVQGASTITQQLIKMVYFSGERSFSRKLKEQLLALFLERRFTKDQILQAYCNNIYLGCGIYGVQAASLRFWNKDVEDLTCAQAASVAAVVQSPAAYCPLLHTEGNRERRDLILNRMHHLGYIDTDTYEDALAEPIDLEATRDTTSMFPHVTQYLRSHLEATLGHYALYHGGYTVATTLNARMQEHAEHAFTTHVSHYRATIDHIDGGLITLDTHHGDIKVMIGGYAFSESQFNRATQARRQMGSIFKPFVYTAAVIDGTRLSDTAFDAPVTFADNWTPRNVHRKHEGEMTYARALMYSNNVITVKLFCNTGSDAVIDLAQRAHLPGPFEPYPSLALGCTESTVLEAAASFNIFANNGIYAYPHLIAWIKNQHGTKIWQHHPTYEPVIDRATCSHVTHVLHGTMEHLRHKMPDAWIEQESIGKTGTTNNARTCWFVGATPDYTTAVYVGRDDNGELSGSMTSVYHALPLWLACHRQWDNAHHASHFYIDPRLEYRYINARTGTCVPADHPQALGVYELPYNVDAFE